MSDLTKSMMEEMAKSHQISGGQPGMPPMGINAPLGPGQMSYSSLPGVPQPGMPQGMPPPQRMAPGGTPPQGMDPSNMQMGRQPMGPGMGGVGGPGAGLDVGSMTPEQQQALLMQAAAGTPQYNDDDSSSSVSSDDEPLIKPSIPVSTLDRIVEMVKTPLMVAIIIFLVMLPQLHNVLRGMLPTAIAVNAMYMIGIKSLIGGAGYLLGNQLL